MFPFAASATKNRAAHRFWGGPLIKVLMRCVLARRLTTCSEVCIDTVLMIFQSWIPRARQRYTPDYCVFSRPTVRGMRVRRGVSAPPRAGEIYHGGGFHYPAPRTSTLACDGPIPGKQGLGMVYYCFSSSYFRVISIFEEPLRKQVLV